MVAVEGALQEEGFWVAQVWQGVLYFEGLMLVG